MSFSGSMIQNAIYIAQQPPDWPVAFEDWERAAEEKLDAGAFGYIAGGAGAESTMRANLDAFQRWRLRPRMLAGNAQRDISVEVLGMRSPAPFFLAPVGVLSIAHEEAEVGVAQGGGLVRRADAPLERRDALDRRGRGDRRAALVPALLGQRPRDLRELRPPRRGRRLRRDRRHARHADARLAAARPAAGVPAVHQRRGLRPVLQRPVFLSRARQDAGGGPAHGGGDDARDVPEPRADLGRPRLAARADEAADPRQGCAHRRRRGRSRCSTASTA